MATKLPFKHLTVRELLLAIPYQVKPFLSIPIPSPYPTSTHHTKTALTPPNFSTNFYIHNLSTKLCVIQIVLFNKLEQNW